MPNIVLACIVLQDRVLDIITRHSDAELKTEAIKFISTVYINEEYLDKDITMKMYKCLKLEALSNHNSDSVQKEVVEFWRVVTRKFLTDKGKQLSSFLRLRLYQVCIVLLIVTG